MNPETLPLPTDAYLQPPTVLDTPGSAYAATTRAFQGIPSIACGPNGRLFAVWYGGKTPGEDFNNYVILALSHDGGQSWTDENLVIDPDGEGPVRAFDPQIWLAPDGRLWLFWAQGLGTPHKLGPSGVWAIVCDAPGAESLCWSGPRRLCDGVMMGKPLALTDGTWALPVSFWHKRERGSAALVVSTDRGATWSEQGACDVPPAIRDHDEHMVVERRDGSLWMLVRTKTGISESVSADCGRTWSPLQPSSIPNACSRFFIRRLASGRLLLVRHNAGEGGFATGDSSGKRSHLAAFLSEDDGQTWRGRLLLDERLGVSYPDGDQAADGTISLIYDYQRYKDRQMLLAIFCEENILGTAKDNAFVHLRLCVNQAGEVGV